MKIRCFLPYEEFGLLELLEQARMAEEAEFEGSGSRSTTTTPRSRPMPEPVRVVRDRILSQATSRRPVYTAVTCPTVRIHPAILTEAVAISAVELGDRFSFGTGTGEALNEHIFGRLASTDAGGGQRGHTAPLGGRTKDLEGRNYAFENAEIYTLPDEPPPIFFRFRAEGDAPSREGWGRLDERYPCHRVAGPFHSFSGGDKPDHSAFKVCYGEDEAECVKTAYRTWLNEALPGELAQVLPIPAASSRRRSWSPSR